MEHIQADTHFLNSNGEIDLIPSYISNRHFEEPLCSIIVTCYNYGAYLVQAVESALAQTFTSLEVIIVDDGSTDQHTIEVVKSFIGKPRVQVIFKHNQGLSSARNTGIGVAQGKYICCFDADDLLYPNYIEQCIFEMESHKNIGFVYSWVRFFGDQNHIWQTSNFNIEVAMKVNKTCGTSIFRKADWQLINGYDSKMRSGFEDWEFWLRIAQLGRCGKTIPSPIFLYRRHGVTMAHRAEAVSEKNIDHIKKSNYRLYNDESWILTVKNYSSVISESFFPKELVKIISNKINLENKKTLLIVLPWVNEDEEKLVFLNMLKKLSDNHHLVIVITTYNIYPMTSFFSSFTDDIFHYANSNPEDKKHFEYFISYLIETRNVSTLIGADCSYFYHAIENIKLRFKNLLILDFLDNSESIYFFESIRNSELIQKHICTSEKIKNSMMEYLIENEKINLIEIQNDSYELCVFN